MTPVRAAASMTAADIARALLLLSASETLSATVTVADVVEAVSRLRGAGLDASHLQVVLDGPDLDPPTEQTIRRRRAHYLGDWYDALTGPDGRLTMVIGDVVGHDIAAAARMGQLRRPPSSPSSTRSPAVDTACVGPTPAIRHRW